MYDLILWIIIHWLFVCLSDEAPDEAALSAVQLWEMVEATEATETREEVGEMEDSGDEEARDERQEPDPSDNLREEDSDEWEEKRGRKRQRDPDRIR